MIKIIIKTIVIFLSLVLLLGSNKEEIKKDVADYITLMLVELILLTAIA